jgi:3-hydroxyacyl-CoA dehydrogenase
MRVLVVGAGPQAAALALRLAATGGEVRLHVPDEHDAKRLRDGLRRLGEGATTGALTLGSGPLPGEGGPFALAIVAPEAIDPVAVEQLLDPAAPLAVLGADPASIAAGLRHPLRLIGLNPAGPVARGALVELIAEAVASDAAARLAAMLRAADLVVLPARDRGAGTLAQRLALRLGDAVEVLLLSGLAPWDLDAAFRDLGAVIGPLEAQDLAGLDAAFALRRRRAARRGAAPVPATPAQDRMVAEGRLGKAAGVGWYRYPGGGGAVIDPLIEDLIAEEAHFARRPRPGVAPDTAAEMALAALLHEGARALDDGTAANTEALDLTARHLLALPAGAPGLRALGAGIGARSLAARLAELETLSRGLIPPSWFEPAPMARLDLPGCVAPD